MVKNFVNGWISINGIELTVIPPTQMFQSPGAVELSQDLTMSEKPVFKIFQTIWNLLIIYFPHLEALRPFHLRSHGLTTLHDITIIHFIRNWNGPWICSCSIIWRPPCIFHGWFSDVNETKVFYWIGWCRTNTLVKVCSVAMHSVAHFLMFAYIHHCLSILLIIASLQIKYLLVVFVDTCNVQFH